MFSLWLIWEPLCEPHAYFFLCISVLRLASGSRVKLSSCKSALTPPSPSYVYSTDRSKAVVPMLVLLFVALWFILRGDLFYVLPCVILFLCFQSFWHCNYLALGSERANLCAFRTFVQFAICACLVLSVSSSSWCLGRDAVCDCGTPWTFLLPLFEHWQSLL